MLFSENFKIIQNGDPEILTTSNKELRNLIQHLSNAIIFAHITNLGNKTDKIYLEINKLLKNPANQPPIFELLQLFCIFAIPGGVVGMLGLRGSEALKSAIKSKGNIKPIDPRDPKYEGIFVNDGLKTVFRTAWDTYTKQNNGGKELLDLTKNGDITLALNGLLEVYWCIVYKIYFNVIKPLFGRKDDKKIGAIILSITQLGQFIQNNNLSLQELMVCHFYYLKIISNSPIVLKKIESPDHFWVAYRKDQDKVHEWIKNEILEYDFLKNIKLFSNTTDIDYDSQRMSIYLSDDFVDRKIGIEFKFIVARVIDFPSNIKFENCLKNTPLLMLQVSVPSLNYNGNNSVYYILAPVPPTLEDFIKSNTELTIKISKVHGFFSREYDNRPMPEIINLSDNSLMNIANANKIHEYMIAYSKYQDIIIGLSQFELPFNLGLLKI